MTQYQMFKHLQKTLTSHAVSMEKNKIIAKRLFRMKCYSNFKLTFVADGEISIKVDSYTKSFFDTDDLFNLLRAFSC